MFVSGFQFEAERLPLIAITTGGIKAKDKMHCIHARVIPYSDFRYCAIRLAKRLYATVVSSVARCVRVQNPNVKKCILLPNSRIPLL